MSLAPAETYRAFRMPWEGWPTSAPDVAVKVDDDSSEADVYMSWNGSTEVAEWRVVGGRSDRDLSTVATVEKDGFETSATVRDLDHVVVEALDSSNSVIGTSEVIRVP